VADVDAVGLELAGAGGGGEGGGWLHVGGQLRDGNHRDPPSRACSWAATGRGRQGVCALYPIPRERGGAFASSPSPLWGRVGGGGGGGPGGVAPLRGALPRGPGGARGRFSPASAAASPPVATPSLSSPPTPWTWKPSGR